MDLFGSVTSAPVSSGATGVLNTQQDVYSAEQQGISRIGASDGAYMVSPGLAVSRTASFYTLDREVSENILAQTSTEQDANGNMRHANGRPTNPPIGQEDEYLPIGDVLLPMLLCVAAYTLVRSRNFLKQLLQYGKRK